MKFSNGVKWSLAISAYCLFAFFGFIYFIAFSIPYIKTGHFSSNVFINPVNYHDHYIYSKFIELIRDEIQVFGFNNNAGIAFLYNSLLSLFGLDVDASIWISYLVNNVVIFLSFILFCNILTLMKLPFGAFWIFFVNTSIIYFLQMINKDSFSILIIFSLIYFSMKKSKFVIFVVIFSVIVRLQFLPFCLIFLSMIDGRKFFKKFMTFYVVTSCVAGYVNAKAPIISYESMGSSVGMNISVFVRQMNEQFFVGYLIFNPIRVVQYFYDFIRTLMFFEDGFLIDVSKLKNLLQIIFFLIFFPFVLECVVKIKFYIKTDARYLIVAILSFFLVWLMNPTINNRYFLLVAPLFIFLGYFVFYTRKSCHGPGFPSRKESFLVNVRR